MIKSKNLFALFIQAFLICLSGMAQRKYTKYDLAECPIHSKIWVKEDSSRKARGEKGNAFKPVGKEYFNMKGNDSILNLISVAKIEKDLLTCFNEFRNDYQIPPVREDSTISRKCKAYSKRVFDKFEHDMYRPKNQTECIALIQFFLFNDVKPEDGDINRLVAESCFDIFVGSPAHMSLLLSEKEDVFGFGIHQKGKTISVVVRGTRAASMVKKTTPQKKKKKRKKGILWFL